MSCLSHSAIKAYWEVWACIQAASTSSMREFHRAVNGRTALFYSFWGWVCTYMCVWVFAYVAVVQSQSRVPLFATPWTVTHQTSLTFTISWSLLKLMPIESVIPSNNFVLCHPLLLLPSIFHSIRVFSNESALPIRWPKYWSFSFSIIPSSEYSGLISFRIDWLDLLAVQRTLKSLLQHHSSEASIFCAQLSLYSNSHIHTWLLKKP